MHSWTCNQTSIQTGKQTKALLSSAPRGVLLIWLLEGCVCNPLHGIKYLVSEWRQGNSTLSAWTLISLPAHTSNFVTATTKHTHTYKYTLSALLELDLKVINHLVKFQGFSGLKYSPPHQGIWPTSAKSDLVGYGRIDRSDLVGLGRTFCFLFFNFLIFS